MPWSARWLSGLGAVAFLLPVWCIGLGYGPGGVELYIFGLFCAAACAVPPFFSEARQLRIACTVGGVIVVVVSAPFAFVGLIFAMWIYHGVGYLAFLALPVTAVAGLTAGFQRAKGPRAGRGAAGFAWVCAAVTIGGWLGFTGWVSAWT
ncbi:hypothetical protein [Kitasatospora brasiliensis]|uniref:hypothetical protein n=1 Tax=Kitasatospora brasiliensis TaxID=3058040 RepID=UPI0029305E8D|nr:hypothetical protein [Kitasatospora sp. K002]